MYGGFGMPYPFPPFFAGAGMEAMAASTLSHQPPGPRSPAFAAFFATHFQPYNHRILWNVWPRLAGRGRVREAGFPFLEITSIWSHEMSLLKRGSSPWIGDRKGHSRLDNTEWLNTQWLSIYFTIHTTLWIARVDLFQVHGMRTTQLRLRKHATRRLQHDATMHKNTAHLSTVCYTQNAWTSP